LSAVHEIVSGRLATDGSWPLILEARLCDLRPRLLAKGRAGRGYRAIARNGRVLVASDRPLEELRGRISQVRLQTWHRAILAGDPCEPYGILVCIRSGRDHSGQPPYETQLIRAGDCPFDLGLDVGGGTSLVFRRWEKLG
jgi:hypothetical protein